MTDRGFDADAYLARVGLSGVPRADPQGLAAVVRAQLLAMPFENLDPLFGRPGSLRAEALVAKLVDKRRGGFCFELNGLLACALGAFGFALVSRLARVVWGRDAPGPRTHQVLLLETGGRRWIADAGFGGPGPIAPIPFEPGRIDRQEVGDFRLRVDDSLGHVLARRVGDDWRDLYGFAEELTTEADIESANHVAATWPGSPFCRVLKCARHEGAGRLVLLEGRRLVERARDDARNTEIPDGEMLASLLETRFGIVLDDELRRRVVASYGGAA